MKEMNFLDETVTFEYELVEVIHPSTRCYVAQDAGERQALKLVRYLGRRPEFRVGKSGMLFVQPPDVELGWRNEKPDRPPLRYTVEHVGPHRNWRIHPQRTIGEFHDDHTGGKWNSNGADCGTIHD